MRRPPTLLAIAVLALLAPALAACEEDQSSGDKASAAEPEKIPFESVASDATDDTEPLSGGDSTRDTKADTGDTASSDDSNVIEVDDTVKDTKPDDTVKDTTPDTRGASDPLCKAAKRVVTLNQEIQYVLGKALKVSPSNPAGLQTWLKKMPIERTRDAYDDLAAAVETAAMRRRVAVIRDFTINEMERLAAVKDLDELNQLVIDLEDDPDAVASTKASVKLSAYTETECGIRIAQGADTGG